MLVALCHGQSWQAMSQPPYSLGQGPPLLMTDGSVFVHVQGSHVAWKLTPDQFGSYVNGTWTQLADTPADYVPGGYASAVLPDGRVLIEGGETNGNGTPQTNRGAIYDPIANSWVSFDGPGWALIGNSPCCVLPNGTFLLGHKFSAVSACMVPFSLGWTISDGPKNDRSVGETYSLLQDGTVLAIENTNAPKAEKYIAATGVWVPAGTTPAMMIHNVWCGPNVVMFDGRVACFGADGHNAIYMPPANPAQAGTWTALPDLPKDIIGTQLVMANCAAVLLPNGHVLMSASPGVIEANLNFLDFDGTKFTPVTGSGVPNWYSYGSTFMMLPTGQVLFAGKDFRIFNPPGTVNENWRPTITNAPPKVAPGFDFTLYGTQFNGFSQTNFGASASFNASNYPLVRIKMNASGHVFYCRTHDHSTMGLATGTQTVFTHVTVPANIELGNATIEVVTNGISSHGVAIVVGPFTVKSVSVSPTTIGGGNTATGTVTLQSPAPAGGLVVNLSSDDPSATVPPSVTVSAGSTTATFSIQTHNSTFLPIVANVITSFGTDPNYKAALTINPQNGGQFINQSVPTTMVKGKKYSVSLQYKNTGLTTWNTDYGYGLQSRNPANNIIWGFNRLPLTNGPIAPGATGTFSAQLTAPSTAGAYNFQWLPIEDAIAAGFGQTSTNLSITVKDDFDDAAFVSRSGSTGVFAGLQFYVQYTMKNTGSTNWFFGAYTMMTIAPNNNTTWGISEIVYPGSAATPPGTTATFTGHCTAPATPGTYAMQWQMAKNGVPFGTPTPSQSMTVYIFPDKAQFVSSNLPLNVLAGNSFTGRVTMKNTGTSTWTQAAGYCLISQSPYNNKTWGTNRLLIPSTASIAPGQSIELYNVLTAPTTTGVYPMQWQMYRNGIVFGDLSPVVNITVGTNPDNSQFVSQKTFTTLVQGISFSANVTMKNIGTSTWTQASGYCLLSQGPSNNTTWGTNRLLIPSSATVVPGGTAVCSNTLKAPAIPGTYTMQWRTYHNGVLFGASTPVQTITVSAASHVDLQHSSLEQWMVLAEDAVALLDMKREN